MQGVQEHRQHHVHSLSEDAWGAAAANSRSSPRRSETLQMRSSHARSGRSTARSSSATGSSDVMLGADGTVQSAPQPARADEPRELERQPPCAAGGTTLQLRRAAALACEASSISNPDEDQSVQTAQLVRGAWAGCARDEFNRRQPVTVHELKAWCKGPAGPR